MENAKKGTTVLLEVRIQKDAIRVLSRKKKEWRNVISVQQDITAEVGCCFCCLCCCWCCCACCCRLNCYCLLGIVDTVGSVFPDGWVVVAFVGAVVHVVAFVGAF